MTDQLLADIIRSFLSARPCYVNLGQYRTDGPWYLTLDGQIEVTPQQANALRDALERSRP